MIKLRIVKRRVERNKAVYFISLLATILFLLIITNWVYSIQTQQLGTTEEAGTLSFYKDRVVKGVELTIDKLIINDLEPKGIEVNLHLIIDNQGNESIKYTNIVIPWDQLKSGQFPSIQDVKVDKTNVIVSNRISQIIAASEDSNLIPVNFRGLNRKDISTGSIIQTFSNNVTLFHQFGNFINIEWLEPLKNGSKSEFTISFKVDGVKYREPTKLEKILTSKLKPFPFNFYPYSGTFQIKLPLAFPFADEIDISDTKVNLAFGHSAVPYKATKFTIQSLNKELEPTNTYGFILYKTTDFNVRRDCAKDITDIRSIDGSVVFEGPVCVLGFPKPIFTEEFLGTAERWYLSSYNPSMNNQLDLMKFAFNPTFHPNYNKTPGLFLIVVDYKIQWWVFLIPLVIVFIILVVSKTNFGTGATIKNAIIITLLVALLSYWTYTFTSTPQIHPNLIDLMYIITLFVALFSITETTLYEKFRIVFPFFVSLAVIMFQFWFKHNQDLFMKVALIYPIVSFSVHALTISTLLTIQPLSLLDNAELKSSIVILWILRLISIALFFNFLRKIIENKLKIKNTLFKIFLSNYLSFLIIWNIFTILIFFIRLQIGLLSIINYTLLLPTIISLLLIIQENTEIVKN